MGNTHERMANDMGLMAEDDTLIAYSIYRIEEPLVCAFGQSVRECADLSCLFGLSGLFGFSG